MVRPRLSDAAFFWEQDRKLSLDAHAARLGGVTFQSKLGSYADKTGRVKALAELIVSRMATGDTSSQPALLDAARTTAARAATLAKADLMTAMVGEFPELQGTMGRYYAEAQGEPKEVALAIEEHYRPRFAGDSLPTTRTGRALALADKLDTLVGIFAIEQRPTGAKDPFGLRRAALGVLRILLEGRLDEVAAALQPVQRAAVIDEVYDFHRRTRLRGVLLDEGRHHRRDARRRAREPSRSPLDAVTRLQALKEFLLLPQAAVLAPSTSALRTF